MRTKNYVQVGLTIGAVAAFWAGCSSSNSPPPPAPSSSPGTAATTVTVHIPAGAPGMGSAAYGTNPLVISQGTSVIWQNDDSTAHTATEDNHAWDTGNIAAGQSSSPIPFNSPGTFSYFCMIHGAASMNGAIQVNPSASPSPTPSPSPSALTWTEVTEQQTCPYPKCPAQDGFTVLRDGAYSTGSGNSGHVSNSELAILDAAASVIAASQSELGLTCVAQQSVPGASSATVDETFSNGTAQQIYSLDTSAQQLCFRGSKENATALYSAINVLAQKYDASGAPGPSPRPTHSPSPSPSITVYDQST